MYGQYVLPMARHCSSSLNSTPSLTLTQPITFQFSPLSIVKSAPAWAAAVVSM